ncbi:hypothetical protein RUM44_001806 [Polyplax serrata]|uniref:Uncharacterized protein n=1 Tax=Polyplax serrata TaxID=468196 RepID=A0ABR1AMK5_POLSC
MAGFVQPVESNGGTAMCLASRSCLLPPHPKYSHMSSEANRSPGLAACEKRVTFGAMIDHFRSALCRGTFGHKTQGLVQGEAFATDVEGTTFRFGYPTQDGYAIHEYRYFCPGDTSGGFTILNVPAYLFYYNLQ